jgi:hypothetical protein
MSNNPSMQGMNNHNGKGPGRPRRRKKVVDAQTINGTAKLDAIRSKTGKNAWGVKSRDPVTSAQLKALGYCGAKKRKREEDEGITYCRQKAGFGTTHPGVGRCKYHGGNRAMERAKLERDRQIEFMGRPKDINPIDAIVWAIKITAGEVEFLGSQIVEINKKDEWIENTLQGKQLHVFQRARADAMDRLVRYSKDAIALGLAERAVRLAEQFGATIARLLENVAQDLVLTEKQQKLWPIIVRNQLILLEGGLSEAQKEMKDQLPVIQHASR